MNSQLQITRGDFLKRYGALARANLLDHEALYDLMVARHVPSSQLKVMNIACWPLPARPGLAGNVLH